MTKDQLRRIKRRSRRELPAAQQREHGRALATRIQQLPEYRRAQQLAAYWPMWGEIDTRILLSQALAQGKQIYLPVIDGAAMWFCRWHGETVRQHRRTGMSQTSKSAKRLVNVQRLDLVLVPLVAFDRDGMRMGQGGGYYDRCFARQRHQTFRKPTLFGVAHDVQETAEIPVDDWDVPLHGIVTNAEIIRC